MKKLVITFLTLFTLLNFSYAQQRSCNSMDVLEKQLEQDPERALKMAEIERHVEKFMEGRSVGNRTVYTIPVVFHVVWNTAAQNISNAQLQSQLDVLNEDFRRTNANANNTWPQAADTEIQFCLATVDPNGNTTSGITRRQTTVTTFTDDDKVKFHNQGGIDAWPAGDYLNFWVCNLNGFLGYAQFPGGPANTDGVVCAYQYVGRGGSAVAPFDEGRTGTHEVGHWLNLYHIWGDGGCNVDDAVADTPSSDAANYGCASGHVSCGTTDMVENYMDYSDDGCMNLFTEGQKTRMQAVLATGGFRASLANSGGCGSAPPPTSCSTPTGLSNGSITASGATSTWNAVSSAGSYDFEYKASSASTWTTQTVTSTSYTITGLSSCTAYETRVKANCGSTGSSSYSSTSSFTTTGCTPTTGCPIPGNLAASNINNTTATATWDPNNPVIDYRLRYREIGGPWRTKAPQTNSWNLTGLVSCTDYEMQIRARCGTANGGNSAYSASVFFTTTGTSCGTPPPASCSEPTGLSNGSITASGATSTWNAVSSSTSYDFEYKASSASSWTSQTTTSASYTITGLSSCTAYETRVKANCGSTGSSSYSSTSSFTTTGCTPTTGCPIPSNLAASNINNTTATATWDPNNPVIDYRLRYRAVGGSWKTKAPQTNSWNLTGLISCTDYEMQVRARCGTANGGNSAYSASVFFTTTGTGCGTPPPPPTTTCTENDITFTLVTDDYGSETSWDLKDSNGTVIESGNNYGNNQTTVLSWCLTNGCYDFTIYDSYGDGICCQYGNGSYEIKDANGTILANGGQFGSSETKNFCLGATPPPPPPSTGTCVDNYEPNDSKANAAVIAAGATIQAKIGSATDIDWFSVKTTNSKKNIKIDLTNLAANYDMEVYYGNTLAGASNNSGTQNEQVIHNETRRRTYFIKVFGVAGANSGDCYDLTTTISSSNLRGTKVDLEPLTQAEIDQLNLRFNMAPNPASNKVRLMFNADEDSDLNINILDSRGKVLINEQRAIESGEAMVSLDTRSLVSGLYFVSVTNGKAVNTKKLIIVKE